MNLVICITEKEYCKAEAVFESHPDFKCIPTSLEENILAEAIADHKAFAAIIGVDGYTSLLYSALPQGGIIARFGVGHDGIDKQKATETGIIVTNTPGVLDNSVAEHTMWLMGDLAKSISAQHKAVKSKNWSPKLGNDLKGKVLLIIGCGAIGGTVARIASLGFGMKVIGYDLAKLNPEQMKRDFGIDKLVDSLEDGLNEADFVSLHLPAIESTRHFVNTIFLSQMKKNAYLINTARGLVLDEAALYDVLKNGNIAGAALDVYETEPYEPVSPDKDLRNLDNIVLTPHISSSTAEACERMAQRCLLNIKAASERKYEQIDIINPEVFEKLK